MSGNSRRPKRTEGVHTSIQGRKPTIWTGREPKPHEVLANAAEQYLKHLVESDVDLPNHGDGEHAVLSQYTALCTRLPAAADTPRASQCGTGVQTLRCAVDLILDNIIS